MMMTSKKEKELRIEEKKNWFLARLEEQFKDFGDTKPLEQQIREASERSGLAEDDIKVMKDVMATSLCQEGGMLLKLHIGRCRFEKRPDAQMNGLNLDKSKELAEHMERYAQLGKRLIIDEEYNSILNSLEQKARKVFYDLSTPAVGEYRFVPNELIPDLRRQLDELKEHYFGVLEVIHRRYDDVLEEAVQNYRAAAPELYRVYMQDPHAVVTEEWVENFERFVRESFPKREDILRKAYFNLEWEFVPETNFLAQMRTKEEAVRQKIVNIKAELELEEQKLTEAKRMQDEKERIRRELMAEEKRQRLAVLQAQEAELKRIASEKTSEMSKRMDQLVGNVVGHLYSMIEEGVIAVKDSIAKRGLLPVSHGQQIARLVERVRALNPNNQEILDQIAELEQLIPADAGSSTNPDQVVKALNEIADYNRSVLAMLGQAPERRRRAAGPVEPPKGSTTTRVRRQRNKTETAPPQVSQAPTRTRRQRQDTTGFSLLSIWGEDAGKKEAV